jgi:hypothetical protein
MQSTSIENKLNNKNRRNTRKIKRSKRINKTLSHTFTQPYSNNKKLVFQTLRFETLINLGPGAVCAIT